MSKKKKKRALGTTKHKRLLVGEYALSGHGVELYLDPDCNGGFFYSCNSRGHCEMVLGVDPKRWSNTVSILMHEATEFVYAMLGLRFCPSPDYARDNAAFRFLMNHEQFGDAQARVGEFIADCFGDLAAAYCKHFKEK